MAGNGHLNPGTRPGAAPYAQMSADSLGPLPHPAQAPVSFTAGTHHLRIDTAAIVANHQPELPLEVHNLDLDRSRPGMVECVDNRFPADTINFVAKHRMQR